METADTIQQENPPGVCELTPNMLPLRNNSKSRIETELADIHGAFARACSRAISVEQFASAADHPATHVRLEESLLDVLQYADAKGFLAEAARKPWTLAQIATTAASLTAKNANFGSKLAVAVLVHTGFEDFLAGMCRIGTILNRATAVERVEKKLVEVGHLASRDTESLIDDMLEKWLANNVRHEPVVPKYLTMVKLLGHPTNLIDHKWKFDKSVLQDFDNARNNGVHGDGTLLESFDLSEFQRQLSRAAAVWILHVCKEHDFKLDPQRAFGVPPSKP